MARTLSVGWAGKPEGTMSRRNGASAAASTSAAQRSAGVSGESWALVSAVSLATSSGLSLAPGSGRRPLKRTARTSLLSAIAPSMSLTQVVRSPSTRAVRASRSLAPISRAASSLAMPSDWVTTARRSRNDSESADCNAAAALSSQSAWRVLGRRSSARANNGAAWISVPPEAFNEAF